METPSWELVGYEFVFDGSWRDIYLLNTDLVGWQRMLDELRKSGFDLEYLRDEISAPLPQFAEDAFPDERHPNRLLHVRFDGVLANCHFFTSDEIEFDIDPREVTGQPQLEAMFAFMRCLAKTVGLDAILTPENSPHIVIFRVSAIDGKVEHNDFGGWQDWR